MTKARSSAWFKIAAVSTISTIKVDRPRAKSSDAPTRLNNWLTNPICANGAGTNEPAWAKSAINAFCRKNVDLPAMFGPVKSQILPSSKSQSFAINGLPSRWRDASTTGWRPARMVNARLSSTVGRTQSKPLAKCAIDTATSSSAKADATDEIASAAAKISVIKEWNSAFSISIARKPAFKILVSISDKGTVVKRTWFAVVWRWIKVSDSGAANIFSAWVDVVS